MMRHGFAAFCFLVGAVAVWAQELPAPPAAGEVFAAWRALDGQAAVQALIKAMPGSPRAVWAEGGYVRLPVNFAGTRHERVSWDIAVKADLRLAKGVQFDFYCADLAPFASFSLYFRSGGGWYHASFAPERVGAWHRIVIDKADTRIEGGGAGWGQVDAVRLSGWRCRDEDTVCAIANLGPAGGKPEVLVIRAESNVAKGGGEARALGEYAGTVSAALDRVGVAAAQVADTDLTPELLEGVSLAVLPYNPSVPKETLAHLKAFMGRGGKLLACYSLTPEVGGLLGLRAGKGVVAEDGVFGGFARTAQGLAAQPAFVPQGSWRTTVAEVAGAEADGVRVVAVWRDATGADTGIPAITLTPSGAFVGHVWFAPSGETGDALMRAVVGELVPGLWRQAAETAFGRIGAVGGAADFGAFRAGFAAAGVPVKAREACAAAGRLRDEAQALMRGERWVESLGRSGQAEAAALRAWMLRQVPRKGEHRAFWCHSAFGLRDKDWDASVRFLAENGFNVILPNMLWAGTAFYPSKTLPPYDKLAERGDQIEQCLAACRKYGVQCHVWKVNWNTGNKAPKAFLARMKAEGRVQREFSGEVKAEWLCPSHPENQALEVASMLEVARTYAVDGIHFDYIRYPGSTTCFCDGCRARFEAVLGRAVGHWPEDTRKDGEVRAAWLDFRRQNIDTVVRQVAEQARKIRPGVKVSAAVFRNWQTDRDGVAQDWKMWCEQGWLDFVCPMDYIDSNVLFRNVVEAQKAHVGRVPLYPGIGLSCWKDPRDAVKLAEQIGIVRSLGLDGFTVFNYDAYAEAVLPYLRLGVTAEN